MRIERISRACNLVGGYVRQLSPSCAQPGCTPRWWNAFSRRHEGIRMHGQWFCSPNCFEAGAEREFRHLLASGSATAVVHHRVPLGLLMLSRGLISQEHISAALDSQRASGGKLGEWLLRMGVVSEREITLALAAQWSCPMLSLSGRNAAPVEWVPFRLMESYRMLPVHYITSRRVLYVAFSTRVDYTALYAMEQMLDCHTEPCVIAETLLDAEIERVHQARRSDEIVIDRVQNASEMAHIVRNYALQTYAEEARAVTCGDYVWVRLHRRHFKLNLLFRSATPRSKTGVQFGAAIAS